MRIEHTEKIDAPIDDVWAVTVDVEALPSMTSTITDVERLGGGPLEMGSQVRLKQPGQRPRVWTVTEFDPPQRFAWSTRAMGMTMTGGHELVESGDGTANTLTIDLAGPLAPIVGPLVKGMIRKALATENQGFKTAAEGGVT